MGIGSISQVAGGKKRLRPRCKQPVPVPFGFRVGDKIQRRVIQHLKTEPIFLSLTRQQTQRRGKISAGAAAADSDPSWIEAIFSSVRHRPLRHIVTFIKLHRKLGFRRQVIFDVDHGTLCRNRDLAAPTVIIARTSLDESPAMNIQIHWTWIVCCPLWFINQ